VSIGIFYVTDSRVDRKEEWVRNSRQTGIGYGLFVYWLLQLALLLFALDVLLALVHGVSLRAVLLVLTAPVTAVTGVIVLFNVNDSIESLRGELRRRGNRGFTIDWPAYSWRAGGLRLTIMGMAILASGISGPT
jgi:hypothetical protein